MIVLDTNAIYYALGISQGPVSKEQLLTYIDENECCIASTTLFELIVNPGNDIDRIRAIGAFLAEREMSVASTVINPLDGYESVVADLARISPGQLEALKDFALRQKVEVESKYASLHFDICVLLGFFFYASSELGEGPDFNEIEILIKVCMPYGYAKIKLGFEEGYKTSNCKKHVSKVFDEAICDCLVVGITLMRGARLHGEKEHFSYDQWYGSEEHREIEASVRLAIDKSGSGCAYLKKLANKYKRSVGKKDYESFVHKMSGIYLGRTNTTAISDHMERVQEKIILNGGSYNKNDLLDAFILSCIDDVDLYVTFDDGAIKQLCRRDSPEVKYVNSLAVICNLSPHFAQRYSEAVACAEVGESKS